MMWGYLVRVPSTTSKAIPTKDVYPDVDIKLSRASILNGGSQFVLIPCVVQEDSITGIKEDSKNIQIKILLVSQKDKTCEKGSS